ncbi:PREDICTED: retrotransposon-like protein 1, partial [Gekko japonicus]|uniref:ribonuclease H n=1 Tax=Gekko japonicus TaxID=146911 RepID=A0ABM1L1R0_GEKJA
ATYQDYADVFDEKEADQLPPHRPYDCAINLIPDAPLPSGRLYPMAEPELAALRDYLDKNLARGFIRPSTSPLSSPVLFVKKKTGDLRLCNDYRALNKITIRDRYPLPLIPELMDRLRGAQIYTKLDLRGAYNLVRIKAGDEWKTAFGTRYGQYEHLVMPFGLTNAPAVFQRFMNDIFRDLLDRFVVIYLDDILIFSATVPQHIDHVRQVLHRLRTHGLYAKLEKCEFHRKSVEFLGHIISPEGTLMDPKKVEAILQWQPPQNRKDVQRLLGFSNYYRQFIPAYADLTKPLTRLLRLKEPFRWTPEADQAFAILKQRFATGPLLRYPDPNLPFVVEADASSVALGAVLSQRADPSQPLQPCAYYSRQLSSAEQNYTIWERELLAIKTAFEVWRHHLEGARHPVQVLTDHRNLEHLQTTRRLNQRQIRWSLFFSRFNFTISYIPQTQNQKADALSRKPEYTPTSKTEAPDTSILPPNVFAAAPEPASLAEDIRASQATDPWAQQRLQEVQQGDSKDLTVKDGVLYHRDRVYVPPGPLRARILRLTHDAPPWPRFRADVDQYVSTCDVCRRAKEVPAKPSGLLRPLPVPSSPWEIISMDFIVDLPRSHGHSCIFVVVDLLTKMAHFVPCPKIPTGPETAQLYLHHIFRLHGAPAQIISDRGPQFSSRFWQALHQGLGTEVHLSSAYHPQTDGQTERTNATLEQYLRCYTTYQQDNWYSLLPLAEFAYNNAVHSSIQVTPFAANYGYNPRFFLPVEPPSDVPAADARIQELHALHELLREQLQHAKEAYKRAADRHRQEGTPLKVGDLIWLSTRYLRAPGRCAKLNARFIGPYKIDAQINPVAFRLVLPDHLRIHPGYSIQNITSQVWEYYQVSICCDLTVIS